jgi:hypothetical protein
MAGLLSRSRVSQTPMMAADGYDFTGISATTERSEKTDRQAPGRSLHKLGRFEEARAAFEAAAGLTGNKREQDLLRRRAAEAADAAMSS